MTEDPAWKNEARAWRSTRNVNDGLGPTSPSWHRPERRYPTGAVSSRSHNDDGRNRCEPTSFIGLNADVCNTFMTVLYSTYPFVNFGNHSQHCLSGNSFSPTQSISHHLHRKPASSEQATQNAADADCAPGGGVRGGCRIPKCASCVNIPPQAVGHPRRWFRSIGCGGFAGDGARLHRRQAQKGAEQPRPCDVIQASGHGPRAWLVKGRRSR